TPHGDGDVNETGLVAAGRPRLTRRGDDRDLMAAGGKPAREIPQLHRRAREEIRLRVDLQDPKGPERHRAPKNSRTAAATASTSASLWPAEIGSVRISSTSCSVCGRGGPAERSNAGVRCGATREREPGRH